MTPAEESSDGENEMRNTTVQNSEAQRVPGSADNGERGSATVIAILVMGLLTIFVSLALSRVSSEAMVMGNDASENRAFYAAQGSLETMTRNFSNIFERKLNPLQADLDAVMAASVPGLSSYTFNQTITTTAAPTQVVITGGDFDGLNATRDAWQLTTTATDRNGVAVVLMRTFFNNRVPIFQFGIFYDDDLEFHPGPVFNFGGRVHSNGNIFLMASSGLFFSSRVTAAAQIVSEVARNGRPWTDWNENVFVKNASGVDVQLKHDMGSVRLGPNVNGSYPGLPVGTLNANWGTIAKGFDGNLIANARDLNLPIRLGGAKDYIELIRRGKNEATDLYLNTLTNNVEPVPAAVADNAILAKERYANKPGIRISFADTKDRLPGCVGVVGLCGVRIDGASVGTGAAADANFSKGYQPIPMTDGYLATRVNGHRLDPAAIGRQVWVKVELVTINNLTGLPQAQDITIDFLSLGVTDVAPNEPGGNAMVMTVPYLYTTALATDGRAIMKIQRWGVPGPMLTAAGTANYTYVASGAGYSVVKTGNTMYGVEGALLSKAALVNNAATSVVPFPIKMFDTREGLHNDDFDTAVYGNQVPSNGTMSLVDIDVANLRRFVNGNFDGLFPAGTPYALAAGQTLRSTAIPVNNGWIVYVSDRRGDKDFDGEYDMEDIFGAGAGNDGLLQTGEDFNRDGILQMDYGVGGEATRYNNLVPPDVAATIDWYYYRRGVRLINGSRLPEALTTGLTLASENGIYVKGNYNATGVLNGAGLSQPSDYIPYNVAGQSPASVVGDSVTILSNAWTDGRSFRYPFSLANRVASETTVRMGIISGDGLGSLEALPNQGGGDRNMTGGVHNFKRFLENWGGTRLNYCGSLINLYNSRNNNGAFKCCVKVYSPPTRNWIFDTSFLDPARLPPGTPSFQFVQITGFQRINY